MRIAKVWIEYNPHTGEIKPWEVWWQAEGFTKRRGASCKDEAGAKKSLAALVKRSAPYYNITIVEK